MTIIEKPIHPELLAPCYDLDDQQREAIMSSTLQYIDSAIDREATNILVADKESGIANCVRTMEAKALPTIPSVMREYEGTSKFVVVLQDADEATGAVSSEPAHVFRVNVVDQLTQVRNRVGLPTFDDALKLGIVSEEDLLRFYQVSTLGELGEQYVNVESNIANPAVPRSFRRPYSAYGYKGLFELVRHEQRRGVVAYQNKEAISSLGKLGVVSMPLVGDSGLSVVNEDKQGTQDEERYFPLTVEITPYSRLSDGIPEHNSRIFTDVEYANRFSRIAALVASRRVNVINIL